jgi:hypothetical protein
MLQQKPSDRPSCKQLLEMPQVTKHLTEKLDHRSGSELGLLGTIRVPLGIHNLR